MADKNGDGDDCNDDNSSSSDEDYLMLNDSSRDRDALVRKKLLENFYGKSAVAAVARPIVEMDEDDDDDDDEDYVKLTAQHRNSSLGDRDNLDSPGFDAVAHTQRHVYHSRIRDLLGVEERLALQVRTLDSTMQTLVYENYSRFIDATDAIRSIGVNVQANETGLKKLVERMHSLDTTSRQTEEALGNLRDQVAEKIRIKRLLSRLDALLKLPQTLRAQIDEGKYRTATRSYISASSILGKHSQGFESLRNIETDCTLILLDMKKLLTRKLLHWNGRLDEDMITDDDDDDDNNKDNNAGGASGEQHENEDDHLPEPPKTMTEIFECVGTLHILSEENTTIQLTPPPPITTTNEDGKEQQQGEAATRRVTAALEHHLGKDELQSLAVGAAARALDRILDAHMIRVQEHRLGAGGGGGVDESSFDFRLSLNNNKSPSTGRGDTQGTMATPSSAGGAQQQPSGALFVPGEFLDSILEVATLYGMTFGSSSAQDDGLVLRELIAEAFSSFLSHVRALLLEESASIREKNKEKNNSNHNNNNNNEDPTATAAMGTSTTTDEEEISSALTLLVQAVQEMAAGLSLPEVGVNADFCNKMVDEAMQLTDSMVARQVHQKFDDLRLSIVKECLVPFAKKLMEQPLQQHSNHHSNNNNNSSSNSSPTPTTKESVARARIIASTTLSDCLQLVDDTIRSILAASGVGGGEIHDATTTPKNSSHSPNGEDQNRKKLSALLKVAVQEGTKSFTDWLAGTLEVLAGGEASNTNRVIDAPLLDDGHEGEQVDYDDSDEGGGMMVPVTSEPSSHTGNTNQDTRETKETEQIMNLIQSARNILLKGKNNVDTDGEETGEENNDFVVAIAEMCRLAQGCVAENLEQSIAAHLGIFGKKHKSRHLFADGGEHLAQPSGGDFSSTKKTSSYGKNRDNDQQEDHDEVSQRFQLAASRIFAMYASQKGIETAALLAQDLDLLSRDDRLSAIDGPRECVQYALGRVKLMAEECAGIFDGPCRAGPVPAMDNGPIGLSSSGGGGTRMATKTSLQLDVERMFKEKVVIHLHPSEQLECSRSSLVFLMMKVALRGFLESVLLKSFSAHGFQQVQVDVEFVKLMIPHYINEDFVFHGNNSCSSLTNLLSDVMDAVAERCLDETFSDHHDEELLHQKTLSILRSFMARSCVGNSDRNGIGSRFVIPE